MPTFSWQDLSENGEAPLVDLLNASSLFPSKKEIRRLIEQGAVKVNGRSGKVTLHCPFRTQRRADSHPVRQAYIFKNHICIMKSMTGYGRGIAQSSSLEITAELSSVNKRNLEITCSTPREWGFIERTVSEYLRGQFSRGKIQATILVKSLDNAALLTWDDAALKATLAKLKDTAKACGASFEITPELLLKVIQLNQNNGSQLPDYTDHIPLVEEALTQAADNLKTCVRQKVPP